MKKEKLLQAGICLMMACSMGGYTSCEDDLGNTSHYKVPGFLVGNAIEVLQKDGNYNTFLKGIELVGYNTVVDEQLLTVLAPTDEAFASFLKEKGYNSIDEMYKADPEYTRQVITYHLLYYAMDWEKMTNFRPMEGDAATETQKAARAGMYNRYRTRCAVPDERVANVDPTIEADSLISLRYDRCVTVFSEKLFQTLGIDAARNYNYFFPNTTWNPHHLANGFNVMNAAVLDTAAVITDNGYLYHIDHVIEPVGTIYEEMGNDQNDYKIMKSLFDLYAKYTRDNIESLNRNEDVYELTFTNLPNIATEWASSQYTSFVRNCYESYNLFIPTDQALKRMFSEFWTEGCGYKDLLSLDPLIRQILIKECVGFASLNGSRDTSYMCYPDYIRQNKAFSSYGTLITTDPATYDDKLFCNNGVIYGSNQMEVPGILRSVVGPAFRDVKYRPFLYALHNSGLMTGYATQDVDFVTLMPDSAQFAANNPAMRLFEDKTTVPSSLYLQTWSDESAGFETMNENTQLNIVNMHSSNAVKELTTKGVQVVETNVPFNYWYIVDGQITTNQLFNEQLNPTSHAQIWSSFKEIPFSATHAGWSNGRSYTYDYPGVFMPASGITLETELSQQNSKQYPYYAFVQLLKKAGLVKNSSFVTSGANTIRFTSNNCRFFAFIPTNEAIKEAFSSLPGCGALKMDPSTYAVSGTLTSTNLSALQQYLLSYFVTADREVFNAYPYVGSPCKGKFETSGSYLLNIEDNGQSLRVSFAMPDNAPVSLSAPAGNIVPVVDKYHYLPFAFSDGAFQLIDEVLK